MRFLTSLIKGMLPLLALVAEPGRGVDFTILHTNDLHSAVVGSGPDAYFTPEVGDGDPVKGHYGRLLYEIRRIKSQKAAEEVPVLTLDAGDFFSGSVFHVLTPDPKIPDSPELEFFKLAGYDAITLGNHEFDAGPQGFFNLLRKNRDTYGLPLLSSNLAPMEGRLTFAEDRQLIEHQVSPSIIKDLKGPNGQVRIGILGIMGYDAALVSMGTRAGIGFVGFDDQKSEKKQDELVEHLNREIATLRQEDEADVIILVAHAGSPEDEDLAKSLEGLDMIIAGHTHQAYRTVKVVDGVFIVQAGHQGRHLGRLDFSFDSQGLKLQTALDQVILDIDDGTPVDTEYMDYVAEYEKLIDQTLADTSFRMGSEVFTATKEYVRQPIQPNEYGTLIASGLLTEANNTLDRPGDLYLSSMALIREDIRLVGGQPTTYLFSDIFRLLPIGYGDDLSPGSPVVSFYLSKKDLWSLLNFLEIYRHVSANFTPAYSDSLTFQVRSWGIPFLNRLKDLKLHGKAYDDWPELIHIVTTSFVADFFSKGKQLSYGLLDVDFRDALGQVVHQPTVHSMREYLLLSHAFEGRQIP